MTPYEKLANAIILSAVRDYRSALKRLARRPDSEIAQSEVKDLERFFYSGWFGVLTSVDPKYLVKSLREEVDL
ncbi:MAG: hypothetical protein PHI41_11315 [Erysipelotrichaceae bacterium]|nr:hypothetical protein [Erysipelotrichaceae bacterium]